ncbi:helix-turn-helix domain-containing protein [Chloroflexota bacterium]
MEHKSLRQLAREMGVSASYLSQVTHGKKQLSPRVARVLASVYQNVNQIGPSLTQYLATKLAVRAHNLRVMGSTNITS